MHLFVPVSVRCSLQKSNHSPKQYNLRLTTLPEPLGFSKWSNVSGCHPRWAELPTPNGLLYREASQYRMNQQKKVLINLLMTAGQTETTQPPLVNSNPCILPQCAGVANAPQHQRANAVTRPAASLTPLSLTQQEQTLRALSNAHTCHTPACPHASMCSAAPRDSLTQPACGRGTSHTRDSPSATYGACAEEPPTRHAAGDLCRS